MNNSISIIIATHEHRAVISNCLVSILNQADVRIEIIVVDNASHDQTVEYVRQSFPSVYVIRQKKRQGFAVNANTGIKEAKGKYILILNPDTILHPGALHVLVRFMDSNPKVGVCGPKLVNPDGSLQLSFRKFPTLKTALLRRTPLRLWFPNSPAVEKHLNTDKDHDAPQGVDWMLGACLLLRRTMLDQIGLFDEHYRLYVEDIDLCRRAHDAGWGVWYVPQAVVMHKHEAVSDRKLLSLHSWYHFWSMVWYAKKYWRDIITRRV